MTVPIPKRPRLRLEDRGYRELKMRILERDGWKCQRCGRRDQLQIHHMIRRSQLGADGEETLIVLCGGCHHWLHSGWGCAVNSVASRSCLASVRKIGLCVR
jgi:5-methylcytosine-specific restriction endonuclease McrA